MLETIMVVEIKIDYETCDGCKECVKARNKCERKYCKWPKHPQGMRANSYPSPLSYSYRIYCGG